jgi:hypothetical protein
MLLLVLTISSSLIFSSLRFISFFLSFEQWKYSDRNNRKRILSQAEIKILGRSKKQATTTTKKPGATAGLKLVPQESDGLVVVTTTCSGATLPSTKTNIDKQGRRQQEKEAPTWQELLLQQHEHPAATCATIVLGASSRAQ